MTITSRFTPFHVTRHPPWCITLIACKACFLMWCSDLLTKIGQRTPKAPERGYFSFAKMVDDFSNLVGHSIGHMSWSLKCLFSACEGHFVSNDPLFRGHWVTGSLTLRTKHFIHVGLERGSEFLFIYLSFTRVIYVSHQNKNRRFTNPLYIHGPFEHIQQRWARVTRWHQSCVSTSHITSLNSVCHLP